MMINHEINFFQNKKAILPTKNVHFKTVQVLGCSKINI